MQQLLEHEPGFSVCGVAADGHQVLRLVNELQPDLLLLDLAMPQLPGLDVLMRLSSKPSKPRTIILTAATDRQQIIRAFELGANGIVLKESASQSLFESIQWVMAGGFWIGQQKCSSVAEVLDSLTHSKPPQQLADGYGLSLRELEIINAIAEGATNKQIAARLSIGEQTVKNHLTAIFGKLGFSNRLELALFAQGKKLKNWPL